MTTLNPARDAVVRPDVRTEAHTHRHRRPLKNPAWLLFLLLTFAVSVGGLFVVAYTLGGQVAPPVA